MQIGSTWMKKIKKNECGFLLNLIRKVSFFPALAFMSVILIFVSEARANSTAPRPITSFVILNIIMNGDPAKGSCGAQLTSASDVNVNQILEASEEILPKFQMLLSLLAERERGPDNYIQEHDIKELFLEFEDLISRSEKQGDYSVTLIMKEVMTASPSLMKSIKIEERTRLIGLVKSVLNVMDIESLSAAEIVFTSRVAENINRMPSWLKNIMEANIPKTFSTPVEYFQFRSALLEKLFTPTYAVRRLALSKLVDLESKYGYFNSASSERELRDTILSLIWLHHSPRAKLPPNLRELIERDLTYPDAESRKSMLLALTTFFFGLRESARDFSMLQEILDLERGKLTATSSLLPHVKLIQDQLETHPVPLSEVKRLNAQLGLELMNQMNIVIAAVNDTRAALRRFAEDVDRQFKVIRGKMKAANAREINLECERERISLYETSYRLALWDYTRPLFDAKLNRIRRETEANLTSNETFWNHVALKWEEEVMANMREPAIYTLDSKQEERYAQAIRDSLIVSGSSASDKLAVLSSIYKSR